MKRLTCLYLDIKTIPGHFLNKEKNALYHLKNICPKCPEFRKKLRDVENKGECWWNSNWKNGNYDIPKTFGVKNWIKQYLFLKTNLEKYQQP